MAMEVLKTAAMTYQGSASSAAKPVKSAAEKPQKAEKPASEPDNSKTASVNVSSADDDLKPMQPVNGDAQEKEDNQYRGHQTSRQLQEAVDKIKKSMMVNTEAVFGIHEGTNRVMIKIVDKESKDVIKEYPPEQTLDMIQKVWEMAGLMVDEKG